jgi:DnaK suppressor protein
VDTERVRAALIAERERLEAEIEHTRSGLRGATDGTLVDDPTGGADDAQDLYNRELAEGVEEDERATIAEVDAALQRLDDGTYGRCVDCDGEIPSKRLEALPYAARCIDCQRRAERH